MSIIVLIVIGSGLGRLDVDFNVESLFPRDDGKLLAFREYTAKFGRDDDLLLLLCQTDHLENAQFITSLDALAGELKKLGLFSEVSSFLDSTHVWLIDDIELGIGPLRKWLLSPTNGESFSGLPEGKIQPGKMAALIASLTAEGPLLGNFLSPETNTAVLHLNLAPDFSDNRGRLKATGILQAWLADRSFPGIASFTLSGMPAARADGMRLIQRDQNLLLPLSLFCTLLMLFLFFRRWRDVGLVMAHILTTLLITLGLMGHLGLRFSILSSVTPVILVTTGSCYSIQIIARLRSLQLFRKATPLEELFSSMVGPLFLANITTVLGFISLFSSSMQLINEFAAITAVGVFIAFLLTITMFPLMVVMFPGPLLPDVPVRKSRRLSRLLLRLGLLVTHWPRTIFWGILILGGATVYLSFFVQVRAFVFDDFRPDSLMIQNIRKAEQVCQGILPMGVMLKATKNEAVLRLHFMEKSRRVAEFLRHQPEVGKVDSPSDFISRLYGILKVGESTSASESVASPGIGQKNPRHPGDFEHVAHPWTTACSSASDCLPPDEQTMAHVLRLSLAGGNVESGMRFISEDLSAMQVRFRMKDLESRKAAEFIDRVRVFLATLDDNRTSLQLSGTTLMIQEAFRNILENLVSSFAIVIFFTLLILMFNFRHFPSLIIGCLANLIPMSAVIGLMGVLDISFKPSTTMIFGIALGLAVDNTIYFLKEYWRHAFAGRSRKQVVVRALRKAGGGMVQSSTSLFCGFLILLFSEFEAQFLIGLLLSFSVAVALVCDLFFVPSGMCLWGPEKRLAKPVDGTRESG